MADLFISYAREDKPFVQRLHASLQERDMTGWVDWEGIPATAEWMREIFAAIDEADSFLFVLSPDSAGSQTCLRELRHAVECDKRLVPVVCRAVDAEQVPEAIARLNWIFLRDEDDFEVAFDGLVKAVGTDLDWVRAHTRLLVRAREWDSRERDKSFLLRGKDLGEAERWLEQSGDKETRPTVLHSQYITASRRAATRRQRQLLGAAISGLVVALALAAFAFYQRQQKEQQRRIAVSRQLATQSVSLLDERLDLALLLALEAGHVSDSFEARSALLTALQHNPRLEGFLFGHRNAVYSLAFSADAKTLASGSWDGASILWDVARRVPLARLGTDHGNDVYGVALSPDGRLLASSGCAVFRKGLCERGEVRLWDAVSGEPVGEPLEGHTNWVHLVAFSPVGSVLASAGRDALVQLWDVETGRSLGELVTDRLARLDSLSFSSDGRLLVASGDTGTVSWDVETGEVMDWAQTIVSPLWHVAVGENDLLATGGPDGHVSRLRIGFRGREDEWLLGEHRAAVNRLAFAPNGSVLASASDDGTVGLWDAGSRQPEAQLAGPLRGHGNDVFGVAWSADGRLLASGDRDGTILLWKPYREQLLAARLTNSIGAVAGLTYATEGRSLVTFSGRPLDGQEQRLVRWDTREARQASAFSTPDDFLRLAFSADGGLLATAGRSVSADGTHEIRLWNTADGSAMGEALKGDGGFISSLAFSRDASTLAVASEDGSIGLWNLASRGRRELLGGDTDPISTLTFSPDGSTLVCGHRDGTIAVWDLSSRQRLESLVGHLAEVAQLAFSSEGRMLVSSSRGKTREQNTVIFWDFVTRHPVGPPLTDQGRILTLVFGPDDRFVALGRADGSIVLLDVAAGLPLGPPLVGHGAGVNALAFSLDGRTLASGGGDISAGMTGSDAGEVLLWDLDFDSWRERACRIANRNLSRDEWRRFLAAEAYRETCSGRRP